MNVVIMLFECNKQSSSDYMYVRSVLLKYFAFENFKFEKIFAGSKCNLYSNGTKRKIEAIFAKYEDKKPTFTIIFYADVDTYDPQDTLRNNEIVKFANQYGPLARIVWFNYDIEDVFWGVRVKKDKPKMAKKFLASKQIESVGAKRLMVPMAISTIHSSNILMILSNVFPSR